MSTMARARAGGNVTLTFDISEAGGTSGNFGTPGDYFLLKRATGSSDNFATVAVFSSPSVSGDQLDLHGGCQ